MVDVGAGASLLVDALLAAEWSDVTLLDVSREALALVKARVGAADTAVSFVVADLLDWRPERQYDAWHDRAVFHFLTDPADRARYVDTMTKAVRRGGAAVLSTFADDGPASCSGLSTARYDAPALADTFGAAFTMERTEREEHVTPAGRIQPFTWVVLRRS